MYSTQLLLKTTGGISGLRGKVFNIDGRTVLPINHPAAALYAPSRMEILEKDFQRMKDIMDSGQRSADTGKEAPKIEAGKDEEKTKDGQLGLF